MRSRYSAYVLRLNDYLLATWHPSTRPATLDFDDTPRWLGLSVKSALPHRDSLRSQNNSGNAAGGQAERATVEFVARYKIGGRAYKLHETSRFVREDGRWFYLDGEIEQ
jgi:SEC-C motif-containing protein